MRQNAAHSAAAVPRPASAGAVPWIPSKAREAHPPREIEDNALFFEKDTLQRGFVRVGVAPRADLSARVDDAVPGDAGRDLDGVQFGKVSTPAELHTR